MHTLEGVRKEVAELRAANARPRVHGNGFIQLDLDARRRLHLFGIPGIPRQPVPTPIHDHSFSFFSETLKGSITNLHYLFIPSPHGVLNVYKAQVREGEDTILVPTGDSPGYVRLHRHNTTIATTISFPTVNLFAYRFRAREFHETIVHAPTVTVITKDAPTLAQGGAAPRVLVPVGLSPDNEFNRYQVPASFLWDRIEEWL